MSGSTSSRAGTPRVGRRAPGGTADRILDTALSSFGSRGYEVTSLDALAEGLGLRKQSILYWFPSKEALLEALIDRSAAELAEALEDSLARAGSGWARVEAVVRSVFRVAARRPELLGLVREAGRLGPPAATRLTQALEPLVAPASAFLESEMDSGSRDCFSSPSTPPWSEWSPRWRCYARWGRSPPRAHSSGAARRSFVCFARPCSSTAHPARRPLLDLRARQEGADGRGRVGFGGV